MNPDPFAALEQLAACPDVHELDALLHPARCAARELRALKLGDKRDLTPRLDRIISRVESNEVFHDPRAERALEVLADVYARLT